MSENSRSRLCLSRRIHLDLLGPFGLQMERRLLSRSLLLSTFTVKLETGFLLYHRPPQMQTPTASCGSSDWDMIENKRKAMILTHNPERIRIPPETTLNPAQQMRPRYLNESRKSFTDYHTLQQIPAGWGIEQ